MKFVIALLAMVALAGAGCSSGDKSSKSSPTSDDTSSNDTKSDDTRSDDPGSGASSPAPATPGEDYWTPFQFSGTESFEFDVEESKKGKTTKGHFSMKMRKVGGKYTFEIEGKMGGDGGSLTGKADRLDRIGGVIVGQSMVHLWVAPLMTVFEPGMLDGTFGVMRWEVGAKWSVEKNGKTIKLEVPKTCKYAGQEGRLMRMSSDGDLRFESCVSKGVSIPLYVKTVSRRGDKAIVTLTKYQP